VWERADFVHGALSATIALDESIVRVRIPFPAQVHDDPSARDGLREFAELTLGHELQTAALWLGECTEYSDGGEPMPADLEPWSRHCRSLVDDLMHSICAAEAAAYLEPSVYCSGQRRYVAAEPSRRETTSMSEIVALTEQALVLCFLAEDVLADETVAAGERVRRWRSRFDARGIDRPAILELVDAALKLDDGAAAYTKIQDGLQTTSGVPGWECEALETILGGSTPPQSR
jgi:hypothetical protein